MGHRILKRVPLDFQAPIGKVWRGYINPYPGPSQCKFCDGSGLNNATKQIDDDFYSFDDRTRKWNDKITQDEVQALVNAGRLMDFTHTWKQGEGWKRRENNYIPTAEEVNSYQHRGALLGGHDTINRWILIKTRAKRLGVWGRCIHCKKGEMKLPRKMKKRHNNWKEFEPPVGPGYQLWETVSEGSPQSPVFATPQELASWCEKKATIFGDEKMSRSHWLRMFTGEEDLDTGSLLVGGGGYLGALANAPR